VQRTVIFVSCVRSKFAPASNRNDALLSEQVETGLHDVSGKLVQPGSGKTLGCNAHGLASAVFEPAENTAQRMNEVVRVVLRGDL
jgi:hypothetical protein